SVLTDAVLAFRVDQRVCFVHQRHEHRVGFSSRAWRNTARREISQVLSPVRCFLVQRLVTAFVAKTLQMLSGDRREARRLSGHSAPGTSTVGLIDEMYPIAVLALRCRDKEHVAFGNTLVDHETCPKPGRDCRLA